jgi:gas vesicle protein
LGYAASELSQTDRPLSVAYNAKLKSLNGSPKGKERVPRVRSLGPGFPPPHSAPAGLYSGTNPFAHFSLRELCISGSYSRSSTSRTTSSTPIASTSAGFLAPGLGIGALVGVLYAPKSGKETRDDLVAGALDARDKAGVLYTQGVDQATQYVDKGKQAATQYVEQGKQVASEYVDKGKEYYDKGRTQWTQYVDKGKEIIANQGEAVTAAVDAGKDAYVAKTSEVLPS